MQCHRRQVHAPRKIRSEFANLPTWRGGLAPATITLFGAEITRPSAPAGIDSAVAGAIVTLPVPETWLA
jgi:hypothetical protein